MIRRHIFDRLARDREDNPHARPGVLLHRSYYLHDTPRLMPVCRLLGHRPVVDGYGQLGERGGTARWVACDRCGVRPDPQGDLDAERWDIGHVYDGSVDGIDALGPWPDAPTGSLGAELIIGRRTGLSAGFEAKVGNMGSEHLLAADFTTPYGAVFVWTEKHGQWLQRRCNPRGYESRTIGLSVGDRRLRWNLWAPRNSWSKSDPKWMQGSVRIDPRDLILGERRFFYTDVGDPVERTVTLPHGDTHTVTFQLQRREHGRAKRGKRHHDGYTVDWRCHGGIPDGRKPGSSGTWGSSVMISDPAARSEQWPDVAAAQLAAWMTDQRARYGYAPASAA